MGSKKYDITVLGRDCIDLVMLENGKKGNLQGLEAGSRLLCKFLKDKGRNCQIMVTSDTPTIEFLAIDSNAVHSQHSIDTINAPPTINIDISPIKSEDEVPANAKVSNSVLVIDDPGGDLLSGKPEATLPCLGEFTPPVIFYQTKSLKNVFKEESAKPTLIKSIDNDYLQKFVVIIDVDVLRDIGTPINRHLSWEKAAADTVKKFKPNEIIHTQKSAKIVWVIRFGCVGAIVLQTNSDQSNNQSENHLYFNTKNGERDLGRMHYAPSAALEAAFLSGLVSKAMIQVDKDLPPEWKPAIEEGFRTARYLACQNGPVPTENGSLRYPLLKGGKEIKLQDATIPNTQLDNWSILTWTVETDGTAEQKNEADMFAVGTKIVKEGIETALSTVPIAKFGNLITVDRREIEEFQKVSYGMEEYLKAKQDKPLSIGVFGAPGSGKSFVIEQIIKGITQGMTENESGRFPVLNYNLSQFLDYSNLLVALQTVRDKTVSGQIPIVCFDEFDTSLNGELGWVKFFLAPMQDGKFFDHGYKRPIGQAIFIFIGGTAPTFEEFQNDKIQLISAATTIPKSPLPGASTPLPISLGGLPQDPYSRRSSILEVEDAKAAKAARAVKKPDFVSRLQLHLDIQGYDKPPENQDKPFQDHHTYMIRRAIFLRSKLEERASKLKESVPVVDKSVLNGLLKIEKYKHGARSIDNIINRSTITEGQLNRSALPPDEELDLHLDMTEYKGLVDGEPKSLIDGVTKSLVDGETKSNNVLLPEIAVRSQRKPEM